MLEFRRRWQVKRFLPNQERAPALRRVLSALCLMERAEISEFGVSLVGTGAEEREKGKGQ